MRFMLVLCSLLLSSNAFSNSYIHLPVDRDVRCLNDAYQGAVKGNTDDVAAFLQCFPKTFYLFRATFASGDGYHHRSAIYDAEIAYAYIQLFFSLNSEQSNYLPLFKIALNGHWEVDAVNYYKQALVAFMEEEPELAAGTLEKLDEKQRSSFWFFYFDGPVFSNSMPKEVKALEVFSQDMFDEAKSVHLYFKETFNGD